MLIWAGDLFPEKIISKTYIGFTHSILITCNYSNRAVSTHKQNRVKQSIIKSRETLKSDKKSNSIAEILALLIPEEHTEMLFTSVQVYRNDSQLNMIAKISEWLIHIETNGI